MTLLRLSLGLAILLPASLVLAGPPALKQEANTWVKRSPLKDGPPSPGMGYEASLAYDPKAKRVIRWAGHNQGGGGEQNSETWVYDPATARWELKEPNTSPPGVCCAQQNVFDIDGGRFLRFAGFSGNHGWHWFRENYLNNSSVWRYDLSANTWRDLRTVPAPRVSSLRCAAWDTDHQVAVLFGGEGSTEGTLVFDPYTNTWHRMSPTKQPAFRSGGNMAYDEARKLHILFGAQFTDDPHTWAYDLRKNEWLDMKPPAQPPTDRNDTVLAYDARNKVVIAVVRVFDRADGKEAGGGRCETWAYDSGKNVWTKMDPPAEPPGWHNRRRIMVAVPDQNVILMENYINPASRVKGVEREQQMWTYRYANPGPDRELPAPESVQVSTTAGAAVLGWRPVEGATGYALFRGAGERPWQAEFREVARFNKDWTEFRDNDLKPGAIHFYYVRALGRDGAPGRPSLKVRTQPRTVEDVTVSVLAPREVSLTWPAPAGRDIVGYHIERAPVDVFSEAQVVRLKTDTSPLDEPNAGASRAIGTFTRLTKEPVRGTDFTDRTVDLTQPAAVEGKPLFLHRFGAKQVDEKGKPYRHGVYAYRVRAVNRLGVEGGPGPYALTIPSAPQWVFAKEDGDTCELKWKANPEQKLSGYRVYRMESPRINGPGQKVTRLTLNPLRGTLFTDREAGKVTRRYWVVAVDALGQEGFPSAPAWHYREYRRFYTPFVGEWHQ
ncbi:MAG: kelch repeat-containing protein [Gemmataceae bacterium]|nr:kelch repeat-containing protein [Gemmataceae bacterium]